MDDFPFAKTLGHFSIGLYLPNQTSVNLNTTRGENGYIIAHRPRSWVSRGPRELGTISRDRALHGRQVKHELQPLNDLQMKGMENSLLPVVLDRFSVEI